MKLLTQPGDGIAPLVKAIEKARKSVEIVIFRFDRIEIERALEDAVKRGVFVHALIAFTNRGGEKNLRKLEMRFLAAGITVARTSNDLVRYHGKMMMVDRKQLYLFAFNFTRQDIDHSRSFGIVASKPSTGAGSHQAIRERYQTTAVHSGLRAVSGQPVERAKAVAPRSSKAPKKSC